MELYEHLTPTKVYSTSKTSTTQGDATCRLCGRFSETLPYVHAGCPALAQSKYLDRHNAALRVLFFEMLGNLKLVQSYSSEAYLRVRGRARVLGRAGHAEHVTVKANRVDSRFVDPAAKKVWAVEMSCPWLENCQRRKKDWEVGPLAVGAEAAIPHVPNRRMRHCFWCPRGWSKEFEGTMTKLFGTRGRDILGDMQKAMASSSENIARTLNVATGQ